ncbi:hypothetical protein PENARI_c005G08857 [Penicillium arizonense]|uniref:Uncharacterized protein n=1 Tax=Penicillium arizonense TaxID=1835702 RepID=A0A1F5LPU2_PENAI|nr:hypothetical protein PENARI_c005G08857 [Penicillium arizonense]OGE55116.1 hypothetical protein PENARI_c005G08857 [Penicillium arizonense]
MPLWRGFLSDTETRPAAMPDVRRIEKAIVSNPLATRYVAKFMHQTGLLAQFQHAEQEGSDDESGDLEVMEQSPEDAGHYPMLANNVDGGENLDALFEYTLPDWAIPERRETTMNSNGG